VTGLGLLLITACSGRALDAPDPVLDGLISVQAHLDARVQPDRLDQAIAGGWALLDESPDDPRVLALLAQAYHARGYGRPGPLALADLDQAYRLSRRCLARNPGWRSRLDVAGGRVVDDATARLLPGDAPCLDTALLALGHRLQHRGPAGWVDLRELALLADATDGLGVEPPSWPAAWARGLALTVSPQATPEDRQAGSAAFREAAAREPGVVTPIVDRLTLVRARQDDRPTLVRAVNSVRQRFSPVPADHPWALENRRGLDRLASLLEETTPGD